MVNFNIIDDKIFHANISDDEMNNSEFIDGIAIVKVNVVPYNGEEYETYSVIEEVINEEGKLEGYSLNSTCDSLYLARDINSITRKGNHFVIERTVWNYDKTISRIEYLQVDLVLNEGKKVFVERSRIPGVPQFVNDKILIITPEGRKSCLFSLEKSDIQSIEYSCIDNIDGETFFVTDTVFLEEDEDIKDRLMFKMDIDGNRISDVYVRSKKGFTDDPLNFPYLLIKERVMEELQENYIKEKNVEKALRRG